VKKREEDIPLQYFERNLIVILIFLTITGFFVFMAYRYYPQVQQNPFAILWAIPGVVFGFQALWLTLNPYAIIYKDKFEIKRTLLSNKFWYFIDIKNVSEIKGGGFEIEYNDGEVEKVSTFGIRASHQKEFRNAVNHYVCKSLVEDRDD
jgi:hypothetical protein